MTTHIIVNQAEVMLVADEMTKHCNDQVRSTPGWSRSGGRSGRGQGF